MDIIELTRQINERDGLENWLIKYPWLTGSLGNPDSAVWFIAENPSLTGVANAHAKSNSIGDPNIQWTSAEGTSSGMFRKAIKKAGLLHGDICEPDEWQCFITNADKEPQGVEKRNKSKSAGFMKEQAFRWLPVLQAQIDNGNPKILVALGNQAEKLLSYMRLAGLRAPDSTRIDHYSYIWSRPDRRTGRGPRHPDRIEEFEESIRQIAEKYG